MPKKKTTEQFKIDAKEVHGKRYDYKLIDYKNSKSKVKIICSVHGVFEQIPNLHLLGSGCPKCAGLYKTTESIKKEFKEVHKNNFNYKLVDYKNNKTKIKIICNKCNNIFEQTPNNHLNNHGCPYCVGRNKTISDVIDSFKKIHKNLYNYSLVKYIDSITKVKIICNKCNSIFEQSPNSHLQGKGCPICNGGVTYLFLDFKNKSIEIHGNRFNYDLVKYKNSKVKVKIKCNKCKNIFEQTPNQHLRGSGCPYCVGRNKTTINIISEFQEIHKDLYDYSLVKYVGYKKEVDIICRKHGKFKQKVEYHLLGSGCPKCVGQGKNTSDIIKEFIDKHGDKYDYSLVNYINTKKKVTISCKKHGYFKQLPQVHSAGQGCPKCGNSISKLEQEVAQWIKDNLFMRKIKTNKRFYFNNKNNFHELDIYIPDLKLGIEFNGLEFHHTHGKDYDGKNIFNKDKYYHRDKSKFFQDNYGIRIIHIWEHEWLFKPEIIKNILKMQLGIKRERIYARKCEIRKISNKEVKPLFNSSHLQGHVNSTLNYGLFHDNELVSVMGFGKSTQGKDAKWELKRFSNKLGIVVIGGAKKLLKAFDKEHDYPSLKSFSMNRIFSGKLYEQLGFKLIKILPPTYFYHKRYKIILRRQAQKKNIHTFIHDYTYTKDKTEVETMNENGYFQVFDTGMNYWLRK